MDTETKILIADDHEIFRRGLLDALKAEPNLKVVGEASDGAEALRLAEELRPDVAVFDIKMPKFDGLEVAKRMRELKLPVEVVILTMYDDEDMFNEALDHGVKGYVLKDSAATEIVVAIKSVLAGRHYLSPAVSTLLVNRAAERDAFARENPGLKELTPAEWRVLRLIAERKTSKEIADVIGVSFRTVENQRTSISGKLNVKGSNSLLMFAVENRSRLS